MNKDLKKIIRKLEDQGFQAVIRRTGHVIILKDGGRVTTFAGSPSDHRSWLNSIADCKRAGFKP